MKLPYASANYGRKPPNRESWGLQDGNQPFGSGRSLHNLAGSHWGPMSNKIGGEQLTSDSRSMNIPGPGLSYTRDEMADAEERLKLQYT